MRTLEDYMPPHDRSCAARINHLRWRHAEVIDDGAVAVTDGHIVAVGPAADIGDDAAEVIEAEERILMPGLVNITTPATACFAG